MFYNVPSIQASVLFPQALFLPPTVLQLNSPFNRVLVSTLSFSPRSNAHLVLWVTRDIKGTLVWSQLQLLAFLSGVGWQCGRASSPVPGQEDRSKIEVATASPGEEARAGTSRDLFGAQRSRKPNSGPSSPPVGLAGIG